ncbi:hypothetical protein [Indibacter alkaliphilus]|uniref:hypothetical protein n=1 Tax=Indibacter alkaliphilus TaxID=579922 RepID=UPI0002823379|nr:hypothetical protein [Indibacter alkaliphilus]
MRNKLNIVQYLGLIITVFASIICISCVKDEDPKGNVNLKVGGNLSGFVNGKQINYEESQVIVYGLSNTVGIIGRERAHPDTTNQLRIVIPLEPKTGVFDHQDNGFDVNYEVITFNNESGYGFNRNKTSKIEITEYEKLGSIQDTTYYSVKGTFERAGMLNMGNDMLSITDGEFDFIYKIWF